MASQEIHNDVQQSVAYNIAAVAANGTTNGNIIDTQGFDALQFVLFVGARTDGTFTPLIQHGDQANLSDAVDVPDTDLVGTGITTGQEAAAAINTLQTARRIGYVGIRRYVRLSVVASAVTSGATVGALAIRAKARTAPTAA